MLSLKQNSKPFLMLQVAIFKQKTKGFQEFFHTMMIILINLTYWKFQKAEL